MSAFSTYSAEAEHSTSISRHASIAYLLRMWEECGEAAPISGDMLRVSTRATRMWRQRRLQRARLQEKSEGCAG